jgi:hypothetical protein
MKTRLKLAMLKELTGKGMKVWQQLLEKVHGDKDQNIHSFLKRI